MCTNGLRITEYALLPSSHECLVLLLVLLSAEEEIEGRGRREGRGGGAEIGLRNSGAQARIRCYPTLK